MVSGRWRGDRVADCARLGVCAARYRGFESHPPLAISSISGVASGGGSRAHPPSARRWVRSHAMVRFRTGSGRERSSPKVLVPGARCPGPSARARPRGPRRIFRNAGAFALARRAIPGIGAILGRAAHLVLAREVPAQGLLEVAGQDVVTRTLRGAIAEGRVGHAYLFFGPRGTGKTTSARLFAKALNCENGPAAEPCGEWERCLSYDAGTEPDLIEIDAASNTGVEHVRRSVTRRATCPQGALQGLPRGRGPLCSAGVQRALEDARGAAGPRQVPVRDDGAPQGPRHRGVALPGPAPLAAHGERASARASTRCSSWRGSRPRTA